MKNKKILIVFGSVVMVLLMVGSANATTFQKDHYANESIHNVKDSEVNLEKSWYVGHFYSSVISNYDGPTLLYEDKYIGSAIRASWDVADNGDTTITFIDKTIDGPFKVTVYFAFLNVDISGSGHCGGYGIIHIT